MQQPGKHHQQAQVASHWRTGPKEAASQHIPINSSSDVDMIYMCYIDIDDLHRRTRLVTPDGLFVPPLTLPYLPLHTHT